MSTQQSEQPVPVGEDAPILEVIATMRAMRRLKPDPVPRELLERLVQAATRARSGGNMTGIGGPPDAARFAARGSKMAVEWKCELGIPRDVHTYAVIPVGWPKGRFGPVTRRPAAEAIHWDRW